MKILCSAILAAALAAGLPAPRARAESPTSPAEIAHLAGGSIVYADGSGATCRDASPAEAAALRARSIDDLHFITPPRAAKRAGLTIVLRGTSQLDRFPEARDAFLRAAAEWESIVTTPVTVVVDVDFGPTRFGDPYPTGVIGSTDPQFNPSSFASYGAVREALVRSAASDEEAAVYASLPEATIPTDEGISNLVYAPVAILRALGLESPVADPTGEADRLGAPPSIGFNSGFDFDFDPSDGIDQYEIDFTGAALHEIGHALGFTSWTGIREIVPDAPVILTTWDMFRFRPGISAAALGTTARVTNSGGEQVYFTGHDALRLSTGRPDGSGGDGRQASHWKDNRLTDGDYIGIMDPTLSLGEQTVVTANDITALDWMGYSVGKAPEISAFAARVDANFVVVDATVGDEDGDLEASGLSFDVLDRNGSFLATLRPVEASVETIDGRMQVHAVYAGVEEIAGAWLGRLAAVDARGYRATTEPVDLGLPDADGPRVATAVFKPKKKTLRLTGERYAGELRVEVNGVTASPRKVKISPAGTRMVLKGTPEALGVTRGENVVRVYSGAKRSNTFTFVY